MTDQPAENPITSCFAHDADMAELVELFVEELPVRINAFVEALDAGNWEEVRRISHQLKGAAPGYGFESVGEAAGRVERLLLENQDIERTNDAARSFVEMCGRVSAA